MADRPGPGRDAAGRLALSRQNPVNPLTSRQLRRAFQGARQTAGIDKRVRFYTLRQTPAYVGAPISWSRRSTSVSSRCCKGTRSSITAPAIIISPVPPCGRSRARWSPSARDPARPPDRAAPCRVRRWRSRISSAPTALPGVAPGPATCAFFGDHAHLADAQAFVGDLGPHQRRGVAQTGSAAGDSIGYQGRFTPPRGHFPQSGAHVRHRAPGQTSVPALPHQSVGKPS